MRSSRTIHVISAHAEGEVGDVIVGGVLPPPGETVWAQSRWIAEDGAVRNFVLNEPRGGVFRHVNLLVPPKDPRADADTTAMRFFAAVLIVRPAVTTLPELTIFFDRSTTRPGAPTGPVSHPDKREGPRCPNSSPHTSLS